MVSLNVICCFSSEILLINHLAQQVTSCGHVFCKACLIDFSASMGQNSCPSCSKPLTVDFTTIKDAKEPTTKTTLKGFRSASILNRIQLDEFQTSTKIDALVCVRWNIPMPFDEKLTKKKLIWFCNLNDCDCSLDVYRWFRWICCMCSIMSILYCRGKKLDSWSSGMVQPRLLSSASSRLSWISYIIPFRR